jgi:hypothetical protein
MGTWIIILVFIFILFSLHPDLLRPLLVINLVGLCLFFVGATLYYGARALGVTGIVNFFDAHPESQRRLNKAVDFLGDLAGRFVKLFLVILCVAFVASGLAVVTINYFANH